MDHWSLLVVSSSGDLFNPEGIEAQASHLFQKEAATRKCVCPEVIDGFVEGLREDQRFTWIKAPVVIRRRALVILAIHHSTKFHRSSGTTFRYFLLAHQHSTKLQQTEKLDEFPTKQILYIYLPEKDSNPKN